MLADDHLYYVVHKHPNNLRHHISPLNFKILEPLLLLSWSEPIPSSLKTSSAICMAAFAAGKPAYNEQ
jgi:hypothetical protein